MKNLESYNMGLSIVTRLQQEYFFSKTRSVYVAKVLGNSIMFYPVTINKNLVVSNIDLYFDYSFNTNTAYCYGMSFKEGQWNYSEYNENNLLEYSENSSSKIIKTFTYDDKLLTKINYHMNDNIYSDIYKYNALNRLVKVTSYDGIITENIYDENGEITKTLKYHKDNPACKMITETKYNDDGEEVGEINEFGKQIKTYVYDENSNELAEETDRIITIKDGLITGSRKGSQSNVIF